MNSSHPARHRPWFVILAAALVLTSYQAIANRFSFGPEKPGIIAAFDLERTFNALDEKKHAYDALAKAAEAMKAEAETTAKSIKQMEVDLDDHLVGSPKHRELLEKVSMASHNLQADIEFYGMKAERDRAATMKNVYLSIRKAIETIAEENNYAIVFVDDSISEIPLGTLTPEEVNRQISARRMAYTSPEVDITDALISRMNAAFQARVGGAGGAAAAGQP